MTLFTHFIVTKGIACIGKYRWRVKVNNKE